MTKLIDLATILRSKNCGPFLITLDILFDSKEKYERVVKSKVITRENICKLYSLKDRDLVSIVFFDSALGIKITYNRPVASGTCFDRDVYGAQQHAPLMNLQIPDGKVGVFFDLQGTLGGEALGTLDNFSFYPGAKEAVKLLSDNGFLVFITTNQSKIAKKIITKESFESKFKVLLDELKDFGAVVTEAWYCPHQASDLCECRKPSPLFAKEAKRKYDVDLEASYVIGDIYRSDIKMAENINGTGILVLTGQGRESLEGFQSDCYKKLVLKDDALSAAKYIINDRR